MDRIILRIAISCVMHIRMNNYTYSVVRNDYV
jgi:hypothetical protein